MWMPLQAMENAIGITLPTIITITYILGGVIFYALDYKIGLMIQFIMSGAVFMWFYTAGWSYNYPLILMFITLVLMSLSMYQSSSSAGVA